MSKEFEEWWRNGGSEDWARWLDEEGGTLRALKNMYNTGRNQGLIDAAEIAHLTSEESMCQRAADAIRKEADKP